MSNIFLDATIVIATWDHDGETYMFDCHKIKNLNTPAAQSLLFALDEGHFMKIKKIGMLLVKKVGYTKGGGIVIDCKKVANFPIT